MTDGTLCSSSLSVNADHKPHRREQSGHKIEFEIWRKKGTKMTKLYFNNLLRSQEEWEDLNVFIID